jgi:hypothetical protein
VVSLDSDPDAVSTARELNAHAAQWLVGRAEALPLMEGRFAGVICLDVLHWASDRENFEAMWRGAWNAVERGGVFLVRTLLVDSVAGAQAIGDGRGGRYRLASGAEWFLPRLADIEGLLAASGAQSPEVFPGEDQERMLILSRKPG